MRTGRNPAVGSTINGRDRHPVVQVAYEDAEAYATGPTSHFRPKRRGVRGARRARRRAVRWGEDEVPNGTRMANTWQGEFRGATPRTTASREPHRSELRAERLRAAGHVRERLGVDERILPDAARRGRATVLRAAEPARQCAAVDRADPRRVIKGGSHLCAPNYCLRYRPAARQGETWIRRRVTSAFAASFAAPSVRRAVSRAVRGYGSTHCRSRPPAISFRFCSRSFLSSH